MHILPRAHTLRRWKQYGLVATKRGVTGVQMIDVAATLSLLRPTD